MFLPMVLNSSNPLLIEKYLGDILDLNKEIKQNGFLLTREDAKNIIDFRSTVLRSCGRVELEIEVTKQLIRNLSESSYTQKDNYVTSINELQEMFYYLKNETEDKIADDELINLLKDYYENICWGSIEFLKSAFQEYSQEFRKQEQIKDGFEKGDE